MAWSISDLFPSWGDSGEQPTANFNYQGGDQVNEKHLDYLWDSLQTLEDETRSSLTDIDSDKDGIVDEADTANLYKGNDIDSDGDGTVNEADSGASGFTITNDLATTELQADIDDDGLVEDIDESILKDGGAREIDAAELDGDSGANGEVLHTDGAAGFWDTVTATGTVSDTEPAYTEGGLWLDKDDRTFNIGYDIGGGGDYYPVTSALYGDGSDGNITRSSNGNENGIIMAENYTIEGGVTRTVSNGVLIVMARDTIEINGTIDASGVSPGGSGGSGGTGVSDGKQGGDGGNGGAGGGVVILSAPSIHLTGSVDLSGENGSDGGDASLSGGYNDENSTPGDDTTGLVGGSGSDGGNGGGGGGSAGGDATSSSVNETSLQAGPFAPTVREAWELTSPGATGGGGGGGGEDLGGGGGGGGGGAGGLLLATGRYIEDTLTTSLSGGSGGTGGSGVDGEPDGGNGENGNTGKFIKVTP